MANNYREIMESIDAILDGDDIADDEVEVEDNDESCSSKELLKEIVGCLRHCMEQESSEDDEKFLEKLKKVRDILKQDAYTDEHQLDDDVVEEDSTSPDIQGNEYGTQGMGPSIDASGKQNYANPQGSSFAARKGFVGP